MEKKQLYAKMKNMLPAVPERPDKVDEMSYIRRFVSIWNLLLCDILYLHICFWFYFLSSSFLVFPKACFESKLRVNLNLESKPNLMIRVSDVKQFLQYSLKMKSLHFKDIFDVYVNKGEKTFY